MSLYARLVARANAARTCATGPHGRHVYEPLNVHACERVLVAGQNYWRCRHRLACTSCGRDAGGYPSALCPDRPDALCSTPNDPHHTEPTPNLRGA